MAVKDQIKKLKDNWLLIVIVLVLFVGMSYFSGNTFSSVATSVGGYSKGYGAPMMEMDYAMVESASYRGGVYMDQDFAPEIEERVITKSASMSTEVERGEFNDAAGPIRYTVTLKPGRVGRRSPGGSVPVRRR